MFCTQCGKQQVEDSVFCEFCGARAGQVNHLAEKNEFLRGKWWYRLVQVGYTLVFVIALALAVGLSYDSNEPYQAINEEDSYIQCGKGLTLGVDENNISLYSDGSVSFLDNDKVKKWCEGQLEGNKIVPSSFIPDSNNYQVMAKYKTIGSWSDVVKYGLYSVAGVLIVFWLLRRAFLYIAIRAPFFRL